MLNTPARPRIVAPCPQCDGQDTLILLGQRTAIARRPLQWATTVTHYFTCRSCSAILPLVEIQGRSATAPRSTRDRE